MFLDYSIVHLLFKLCEFQFPAVKVPNRLGEMIKFDLHFFLHLNVAYCIIATVIDVIWIFCLVCPLIVCRAGQVTSVDRKKMWRILHGRTEMQNLPSSVQKYLTSEPGEQVKYSAWEEKFHISKWPCNMFYLLHKHLWSNDPFNFWSERCNLLLP